tara:strand:+ start:690 stop:1361 length:672 start_codon:yes stop_codon:yes gene_type:complete
MDEPVDDLQFSKRPRTLKGSTSLFREEANFIQLPPPPANSSLDTAKELLAVQGASYIRKGAIEKSIKKHDKDPAFSVKLYMSIFGLKYDQKYIDRVLRESSVIISGLKNKFNRPRPKQLCPYFGMDVDVLKSASAKTPSYPSGHTTQARLIAEIYSAKYPEHRSNLVQAAEECGQGRIMAGLHFPKDHVVGRYLAKRLFKALNPSTAIEYDQSYEVALKKRKK